MKTSQSTTSMDDLEDQLKQKLFQEIFKHSDFSRLDGLNEYDEDYRGFTGLGELIPAEMQAALARLDEHSDLDGPSANGNQDDIDPAAQNA